MRRGSKITVPYTLCLFAALSAVVLLVGGAMALLAYRDTQRARPEQAYHLLSRALDDGEKQLAARFEPALEHLRQSQQWITRGELRTDSLSRWSNLLLTTSTRHNPIQSIVIYSGDGPVWRAVRQGDGWSGAWRNPTDIEQRRENVHWDPLGSPVMGDSIPPALDEARYTAALEAFSSGAYDSADGVYINASGGVGRGELVLLAMATGRALGPDGIVALEIDSPLKSEVTPGISPDVFIQSDPEGMRLSQLKRSQTLSLLTSQAVPDGSNLALRTLFPAGDGGEDVRWYAARAYPVSASFKWWNVATVSQTALPAPTLPVSRYAIVGLIVGLVASSLVAVVLGWRISAPLAHIARRARSVQAIDEHYLPWPRSRFSEVNALTGALEELYESAVEHLDYYEAPLVVWAQQESLSGTDDIKDTQPLKRHINLRGDGRESDETPEPPSGPVINVDGSESDTFAVPAVQMQLIHGSRREVRRLQGQLAGIVEELRTAGVHFQQGEDRLKRQRAALRLLDKQLQKDAAVTSAALTLIHDALGVATLTLWRFDGEKSTTFDFGASTESNPDRTPIADGIVLRSLLREELVVSTRDLQCDPRLVDLTKHPRWAGSRRALALAPFRFRNTLLGFLLAEKQEAGAIWRADEEAFLSSAAIQCTMALGARFRNGSVGVAPPVGLRNGNGHSNGNGHAKGNGESNGNGNAPGKLASVGEESGAIRWETDLAGCIRALDGDVAAIYGYAIQDLIGQPISFLSSRVQGERDLAQLRNVLAGVPCVGHEAQHRTADGDRIALLVWAEAQRDASGRIVGVRGTATPSAVPAL